MAPTPWPNFVPRPPARRLQRRPVRAPLLRPRPGPNTGASTCECTYSYTSPSVGTQTVSVDTTYYESNLIECPYTQIPGDVTTVNVSVLVTTQNASSNVINFNLTGISGSSPTSASSYTLASRYQCKDIVSIPYAFGPSLGTPNSVYDPIQSESASINYPLDFYTLNLGGVSRHTSPTTFKIGIAPEIRTT